MSPQLQAGVARAVVTPPVGIAHPFWGAQTHTRAEGVIMDLYATALVLSDGATRAAILDIDIPNVPDELARTIRRGVERLTGIPAGHVRVSATHTHSGGPLRPGWFTEGAELIDGYVASLVDRAIGAVWEADKKLAPARLAAGLGHSTVGLNRRMWLAEQSRIVLGRNYGGFVDHEMPIARIDDEDERPLAVLVNYPCHPTIMAHLNSRLTPDFPGPLRRTVEEAFGGTCLFLQGAAGDRHPKPSFSSRWEDCERVGALLGLEAAKVALGLETRPKVERLVEVIESGAELGIYREEPGPEPDATIRVASRTIELPLIDLPPRDAAEREHEEKVAALAAAREGGDEREIRARSYVAKRSQMQLSHVRAYEGRRTAPAEIQVMRVGDLALVAMPGEPFAQIGVEIRRRSPFPVTMVSGYSNGNLGYVPMRSDYANGGYGVWNSPLAPGSAEALVEASVALLGDLRGV